MGTHKAPAAGTVVKKARVDQATGKLVDWLEAQSAKGVYNIMVFDTGEQIQVPGNFGIPFDLVIGETYAARWAEGKLTLVEGSEFPEADESTEGEAF